ncbi:MAG: lytic transglycosylase domain-containing protein [Acidimicrobiales bacterium]
MPGPVAFVAVALAAVLVPMSGAPFLASSAPPAYGIGPSAIALAEIPAEYLALYQRAAVTCPGLSWSILAAIGFIESGHGGNNGPSSAGALGPMQFMPPTWAAYGVDGDGDGVADIWNPADAIFGAANYLCANGAGDPAGLRHAIWRYNHSQVYVEKVLAKAAEYSAFVATFASPDAAALLANPNVTMTAAARSDLAAGIIDPRVVTILNDLGSRHTLSIVVFKTGHSVYVAGTTSYSNHYFGRAVDISKIDGEPVSPSSPAARVAVLEVLSIALDSPLYPAETGHPFADLETLPGSFTNAAHLDHIHIGWD